jgi:ATP-dependent RNA circularization protein (DNA/RNA ligase family)
MKPLNRKNYGSIGHLPKSRKGPAERSMTEGQARIATEKARDKHDVIICQEKLDGSNVGVCLVDGEIYALGRSGYTADSSPYEMHHWFARWVRENEDRFLELLSEGERVCGEWLTHAHGTKYDLPHEPFVAFDIFTPENQRIIYEDFKQRACDFVLPYEVSVGPPVSVEDAMEALGEMGKHGALEPIEGVMWRIGS